MTFDAALVRNLALITLAALLAIWAVRHLIRVAVRHVLERPQAADGPMSTVDFERRVRTLQALAVRVATVVILLVAILMAFDELNMQIGPALAGLGVVGIAVGFGAQALIRDWLAGIFIVLENQFSTGDVVRIAGVEGVVEDFSLRRTALRDLDGTVHSVPNGQIVVASNLTRGWSSVNVDVTIPAAIGAERGTELIDRVGRELAADPAWADRLLEAPHVDRVTDVAEAGVSVKVLGRVRPAEQWSVGSELRKRVYAELAREGSPGAGASGGTA